MLCRFFWKHIYTHTHTHTHTHSELPHLSLHLKDSGVLLFGNYTDSPHSSTPRVTYILPLKVLLQCGVCFVLSCIQRHKHTKPCSRWPLPPHQTLALDLIGQHGSWSPWQPWHAARRMETSATEAPEPHPPPANLLISQVYLWVPGDPWPWTERDPAVASSPLTLKALKSYCLISSLILSSTSLLDSDDFALEFVRTGERTLLSFCVQKPSNLKIRHALSSSLITDVLLRL